MRGALYFIAAALVAASAFWAYRVNYQAQEAQARVAELRAQIGREREAIGVLRAEWAWLTAPDRLRALVDANAPALGLVPLSGGAFLSAADAPRPAPVAFDAANPSGSVGP